MKFRGVLRAATLLVGVWAILFSVGLGAGVLPQFPWQGEGASGDDDTDDDDRSDGVDGDDTDASGAERSGAAGDAPSRDDDGAGVGADGPPRSADATGGAAGTAGSTEADVAGHGAAEGATPADAETALARYAACPEQVLEPTLTLVSVLRHPRPQLFLGCGAESHLLALEEGPGGTLRPVRVAKFRWAPNNDRGERGSAVVAASDVNGDGRPDLLIGHVMTAARGAAQNGALFYVPRDMRGGFDEAVVLAPVAVASIATGSFDRQAGADIVALHQADTHGRRPSEAWVFSGGSAPGRRARLDAGVTGRAVQVLDMDRDGHADVVTVGEGAPGARIHFGDGQGQFPRTQPLVVAGAREAVVGDLDGDGAPDLLLSGDGVRIVRAHTDVERLVAEPLDLPSHARAVQLVDVDGNGRLDIVAVVGDGIAWFAQVEHLRFEARSLLDLPLAAGTPRVVLAGSLGGGPAVDLALLVKLPGEAHGHELVLALDVAAATAAAVREAPSPIPEAPLSLQVDLR